MRTKDELVEEIKRLANAYYSGQELVSDKEYDALIEELRVIDPENELIAGMAGDEDEAEANSAGYPKVKHTLTTGTLSKAMTLDVFEKWVNNHKGPYHCSSKMDGAGFELVYENGKLTKLISRGNGFEGFNKIALAQYLSIPKDLGNSNFTFSVRGEFEMSNKTFKSHAILADKKNPRNAGSGLLNLKVEDLTEEQKKVLGEIQFFAYDLRIEGNALGKKDHKSTVFTFLKDCGFTVPVNRVCNSYNEVVAFREELAAKRGTDEEEFAIDGIVVFEERLDADDQLERIQKKAIAVKFDLMVGEGTILDIEWSLNGSYLTPIAIMTPMQLDGTTVTRAKLCNLSIIKKLGIKVGDKVRVAKMGEIIPKVLCKVSA